MAHVIEETQQVGLERPAPFAVSWQKLMMWIFIITDGLLFAGFLAAYGFARLSSAAWPEQSEVFHIGFITAMTFILISSSATMAQAVEASQRKDPGKVLLFLLLTILGGASSWECRSTSGRLSSMRGQGCITTPGEWPNSAATFS